MPNLTNSHHKSFPDIIFRVLPDVPNMIITSSLIAIASRKVGFVRLLNVFIN